MSQPAARPPPTPQPPTPGSMEQASSNDLTGHSAFCSQGCKPSVNGLWWSLGLAKNLFQLPMVVAWVGGLCRCWWEACQQVGRSFSCAYD